MSAAEFRTAWAGANAECNPTPEALDKETLDFVNNTLRALCAMGTAYHTEQAQYVGLYAAWTTRFGRKITTVEAERLRRTSQAVWRATCEVDRPKFDALLGRNGR